MGLFNWGKKAELLRWQKFVLADSPDRLIMTEKQLRDATVRRAKRDLEIADDCSRIVQTTTKPSVFFSRLSLFEEKLADLVECEKYISFTGASPSAALAEAKKKEQKCISAFLQRNLYEVLEKAEAAKTPAGKISKINKFQEGLAPYYGKMSAENVAYIEKKHKYYSDKFAKK